MANFDNEHTANTELDVVLFESSDGAVYLPVNIEEETVWLTQAQMAELFDRSIGAISRHIKNVFDEKELVSEGNLHFLQIANADRPVAFYSLDVIISVGYRVKSQRGVEFRRWATSILRQYILKGHVENDERFRQLGTVARIIERLPHELGSRQILDIVESYTDAFRLLDEFDREAVARPQGTTGTFVLEYDACMELISQMRPRFVSDIFGVEKTIRSGAASQPFTRALLVRNSIRPLRRKQLTCSTSSSRITRLSTATNASRVAYSYISSIEMDCCSTGWKSACPIARWWPWRSLCRISMRASRRSSSSSASWAASGSFGATTRCC